MIRIDVATLFPEMCEAVLQTSIIGRARKNNLVEIHCHNIRDYSPDPKHHRVDDSPYGGGKGMVMQPEPIYRCYLDVVRQAQSVPHVIYLSPQGKTLNQQKALALREVSQGGHLPCGRSLWRSDLGSAGPVSFCSHFSRG